MVCPQNGTAVLKGLKNMFFDQIKGGHTGIDSKTRRMVMHGLLSSSSESVKTEMEISENRGEVEFFQVFVGGRQRGKHGRVSLNSQFFVQLHGLPDGSRGGGETQGEKQTRFFFLRRQAHPTEKHPTK